MSKIFQHIHIVYAFEKSKIKLIMNLNRFNDPLLLNIYIGMGYC